MEFEADRMTGLVLTDEVVQPELQGRARGAEPCASPTIRGARLGEQMDAALYLNHPYGKPVIGWRQEIEKLTREDALAFYRRFYTPNNAVLVVAGDVTAEEVKALAEETYGKVARVAEIAPRARPQEPAQEAARTVTLADPRVDAAERDRATISCRPTATAKPRRRRSARSAGAYPRRAARTAGSIATLVVEQGHRGQRRRRLRRHRARRRPARRLWRAEAGRSA